MGTGDWRSGVRVKLPGSFLSGEREAARENTGSAQQQPKQRQRRQTKRNSLAMQQNANAMQRRWSRMERRLGEGGPGPIQVPDGGRLADGRQQQTVRGSIRVRPGCQDSDLYLYVNLLKST